MTSWWGWATRRADHARVLVGTLLALVIVTTAILAFVVGHAGALATDAARAALSTAEPGAGAVQAQTRIGDDPAAQDRSAREKLEAGFAPAPVQIHTSYVSEPRRATLGGAPVEQRVTLWAGDHLTPGLLEVTDGSWPAGADEAALHAGAAAGLGVSVGDTLTVDDHGLKITALWEPKDKDHPIWFGDPLITEGADATSVGPLVVDRSVQTGGDPFIRWSVVPDSRRITPEQLEGLADSAERAKTLVAEADLTGRGIVIDGNLVSTAERASRDWSIGRAFGIVPVSVLLLVAAVGLVQVSGLLAATRRRELELLAARGASRPQLIASGLGEATVLTVLGAAVGTGLALAALWLATGDTGQFRTVVLGGLGGLVLALACLGTVSIRAGATPSGRPRTDRVRAVAGAASLLIVFAAAGITTWQLRRSASFELVPALAPALLLAAAAVVGLAALGPLSRLIERLTRRAGTGVWLAGAQLARGLVVHAVPVTLTILATGTATLASVYAGTAAATHRDLAMLANGAPLRAGLSSLEADVTGLTLPDLASVDGVAAAVPVWFDESARVGDTPVTALAAPMDKLPQVASLPTGITLPELPETTSSVRPIAIPDGTATLSVMVSGRVFLDPWQQEHFDRVEEFNEARSRSVPAQDRAFLVQTWTEDYYRSLREPPTYSLQLTLRDLSTGLSRTLPGPSLTIESPDPEATPQSPDAWFDLVDTASAEIELPREGEFVVESVQIAGPLDDYADRSTRLEITLSADGQALTGAEEWTSDQAIPWALAEPFRDALAGVDPKWEVTTESVATSDGNITHVKIDTNKPPVPQAVLDTREATWRLDMAPALNRITVGRGVAFTGEDPLDVMSGAGRAEQPVIPVAITAHLAEASALTLGDSLDLGAFGRRLPARIDAITPAIPGSSMPNGVLADSAAVAAHLSTTSSPLRWPSQLWAGLDGDPAAARTAAARLPGITSVSTADEAPNPSATAARSLWIAAGSALVLSVSGLAAAAATQLGARRSEVAVLRALGMTPREQGRSRAWETGGVLAIATAAGIAAGWLVGWLVVPPIVAAASDGGARFRSRLTVEPAPWLMMLACGAFAVAVILVLLARSVRAQALDAEYREEVR